MGLWGGGLSGEPWAFGETVTVLGIEERMEVWAKGGRSLLEKVWKDVVWEERELEQSRGAELLRQGSHDHCCDEIDASHLLLLSIYTTPSMEAAQPERRTDRCFDPGLESWWDLPIAMRKSKCRVRDPRALRG